MAIELMHPIKCISRHKCRYVIIIYSRCIGSFFFFFFLFHSGGVVIYITQEHYYYRRNETYLCGKQTNISFLIMEKTADIEAWGFNYHSYSEGFRKNNGTKFLADFKALPEESFLGM